MRSSHLALLLTTTTTLLLLAACADPAEDDEPDDKGAANAATAPDETNDEPDEPVDDGTRVLRLEIVNLTGQTIHLPDQPSRFWLRLGYGNEDYYGDLRLSLGSCTSPDCVPEPITLAPGETLSWEQDLTELLTTCERGGSPTCPQAMVLEYGSEVIQAWNPFTTTIHPYVFGVQVTRPFLLPSDWTAPLRIDLTEAPPTGCGATGFAGRLTPTSFSLYTSSCFSFRAGGITLLDFGTNRRYSAWLVLPKAELEPGAPDREIVCSPGNYPYEEGCQIGCWEEDGQPCEEPAPNTAFRITERCGASTERSCIQLDYLLHTGEGVSTGIIELPLDRGVDFLYGECWNNPEG